MSYFDDVVEDTIEWFFSHWTFEDDDPAEWVAAAPSRAEESIYDAWLSSGMSYEYDTMRLATDLFDRAYDSGGGGGEPTFNFPRGSGYFHEMIDIAVARLVAKGVVKRMMELGGFV